MLVCIWANIMWETLSRNKVQYRMGPRKFEVKEGRNRPAKVDSNWSTDTRSPGFMCDFVISGDFERTKGVRCCFPKIQEEHEGISHDFASAQKSFDVGVMR